MSELVLMSVPIDFLEKNVSNKLFISYNWAYKDLLSAYQKSSDELIFFSIMH